MDDVFSRLKAAQSGTPKPAPTEKEKIVRQTLYLRESVHDVLRDLAHTERTSQQRLFHEALDLLFQQRGLPRQDEIPAATSK